MSNKLSSPNRVVKILFPSLARLKVKIECFKLALLKESVSPINETIWRKEKLTVPILVPILDVVSRTLQKS